MKIIDLLINIANGEGVPNKIKHLGKEYIYDFDIQDYRCNDTLLFNTLFSKHRTAYFINDEVEIIEEDKKIEKISLYYRVPNDIKDEVIFDTLCEFIENQRKQEDKTNELIDKVNSLENKDV